MACIVPGCQSSQRKTPALSIFKLPRNESRAIGWLKLCCREDLAIGWNVRRHIVCERHFMVCDFKTLFPRKLLQVGVKPSLNLPTMSTEHATVTAFDQPSTSAGAVMGVRVDERPDVARASGSSDAVPGGDHHHDQNTIVVEVETAIAPEDNDPVLCSGVKKEDVTEQCEDSPFVNRCDDCQTFFVSKNNVKADRSNIQDRYRCSECQVGFKNKHRLHRHINSVHSYETIYSCDYCQKKFTNKEYILIHMKIKHARGSFKCDESEPNIYVCDYCGKTFTYKSNIIPHLYKHTANTKCAICDASVKPARMKQHVLRMHGDEEGQCEHCGETVKSEYGFQQHVNDHHGHDQRDQQSTGTCGEHNQQSTCSKFGEESGEGTLPPEVNAVASASSEHQYELFIKEESADQELDLGPVVFQHIDSNYRPYKEEPLLD